MAPSSRRILSTVAVLVCASLCGAPAALAKPAQPGTSSSAHTVKPKSTGVRAAAARSVPGDAITFDEFDEGTWITDEYAGSGVVFDGDAQLTDDHSSPTAPVLTGYPKFFGDISAHFVVPGTATPTTVSGFAFDVGYIDNRDSVQIDVLDAAGNVVLRRTAQSLGINHVTLAYRGAAGFRVHTIDDEPAGFAIDNLTSQPDAGPSVATRMVAFGDSYTSGEGLTAGDNGLRYDCATDLHKGSYWQDTTLPAGFRYWWGADCDTRTLSYVKPADLFTRPAHTHENLCHRNARAYPNQIRAALGIDPANYIFVACSGATTENVGIVDDKAQYPNSPVNVAGGKSQLDTVVPGFTDGGQPNLVTIGMGGNDAGFGELIKKCLAGNCLDDDTFVSGALSDINNKTFFRLRQTFEGLRDRFPSATVVAFGYPSVVGDPDQACASVGTAFWKLDHDELAWMAGTVLPAINAAVSDAAAEAGVVYADITAATVGHELCANTDDRWVNGLVGGDDVGKLGINVVGNESFHPNQRAHDAIARYFVEHYTDGAGHLLVSNPEPSGSLRPPDGSEIDLGTLDAGALKQCGADCLQPAACVQACVVQVQGGGYSPGTDLTVTLHSDPVTLGVLHVDDAGNVDGNFQLPAGVPLGIHAVTVEGLGTDDEPQYGTAFVNVFAVDPGLDRVDRSEFPEPVPVAVPVKKKTSRIASTVSVKWRVKGRSTRVRSMIVKKIPARSTVKVACKRKHVKKPCGFASRTYKVKKAKSKLVLTKAFKHTIRSGTQLTVSITRPAWIGKRYVYTTRTKHSPKVARRCTMPGKSTARKKC